MDKKGNETMCSGQCAKCPFQQRVYCAAYLARNNYAMMESVIAKMDAMQMEMDDIHKRVNAIQSNEGELIKPFIEESDEKIEKEIDTMGQAV